MKKAVIIGLVTLFVGVVFTLLYLWLLHSDPETVRYLRHTVGPVAAKLGASALIGLVIMLFIALAKKPLRKDRQDAGNETALSPKEQKLLEELIKRFNEDSAYRRQILQKGNSAIVQGERPDIRTAEGYLIYLAAMNRY